ncbi:MAG: SIS domain-containing protein [Pelolinea sp.]|nr:SIS domain-containing protein [Pelolinea sp.]
MNGKPEYLNYYLKELTTAIDSFEFPQFDKMVEILEEVRQARKKVFIIGNGGSASSATHIANDWIKNTRQKGKPDFKVLPINDIAIFSAYANDEGYESVYAEQIRSLGEEGDVLIAMSTSGNSPNVLKAIETAKEMGIKTIGWTGKTGGKMRNEVDLCLGTVTDHCGLIEDTHMIYGHIITIALSDEKYTFGQ